MRLPLLTVAALLAAAPAYAQVTPNNPPGSDSMSRATHPDTATRSAPEASTRSDSSVQPGARESETKANMTPPPNQPGRRPDQGK